MKEILHACMSVHRLTILDRQPRRAGCVVHRSVLSFEQQSATESYRLEIPAHRSDSLILTIDCIFDEPKRLFAPRGSTDPMPTCTSATRPSVLVKVQSSLSIPWYGQKSSSKTWRKARA